MIGGSTRSWKLLGQVVGDLHAVHRPETEDYLFVRAFDLAFRQPSVSKLI